MFIYMYIYIIHVYIFVYPITSLFHWNICEKSQETHEVRTPITRYGLKPMTSAIVNQVES